MPVAFLHASVFFFNDTATTEIYTVSDIPYTTLFRSLRRRLGVRLPGRQRWRRRRGMRARVRSEEHTSELQSPDTISYAVFCLKKKKKKKKKKTKKKKKKKKKNKTKKKKKQT